MLEQLLVQQKDAILRRWLDLILEAYGPDARSFLRTHKDPFANPVGHALSEGMKGLFDGLVQGLGAAEIAPFLDRMVRVRAVQDLPPSGAVGFILSLKAVIREALGDELDSNELTLPLRRLEGRIDALTLQAFDAYELCRERIHEIRVNEVRNRTYRLLKRYNLISELEAPEAESPVAGNDN
jgi:hypothetical protein